MKILITGGHLSPAIAVIEELKKDNEIFFIGRKYALEGESTESLEFKTIGEIGIIFYDLKTGRYQRKFTKHTIPSVLKIPRGIIESILLVKKIKPDIILTFGGYIGLPVSSVAYLLGIPVVLHEQTQDAGLANKIISKFSNKVCISFDSSRKYFPQEKTILTGNPIRQEIFKQIEGLDIPESLKIIYITGGSAGSHFINQMVYENLSKLLEKYIVIHQTGESSVFCDLEKLEKAKNSLPIKLQRRYILKKFVPLKEIGWVYKKASIVVARSGINTVCELLALQKLCFLIPLPHGQNKEQLKNAQLVKKEGIGDFMEQDSIDSDIFIKKINIMLDNESKHHAIHPEKNRETTYSASSKIADVLNSIYEQTHKKKN